MLSLMMAVRMVCGPPPHPPACKASQSGQEPFILSWPLRQVTRCQV